MFHRKPQPFPANSGIKISRLFTKAGEDPYRCVEWERRRAEIKGTKDGKPVIVFEQDNIEVPKSWSQLALNVVAQKYFRGSVGDPSRENSVRHLVHRVVHTITNWGIDQGYFLTREDYEAFHDELVYMILKQMMAFNSPVWFNVGSEPIPQCSACFINSVEDSMESILELAKVEGMLFKGGSGTGTNLSTLRSKLELVTGGAHASGPVSFMKGYDAFAGVIKSGGKTRRAAKMVVLNVDHPDVPDFIECKALEERKAWALIDAGYDGSFNGEAYNSVFFQNSNNSVRVNDTFMEAVINDQDWELRAVRTGKVLDVRKANVLWDDIAKAAHACGDPGLQFDTMINEWHTCPNCDRIHASNPCTEYMFLNDSACNLASLNLRKFQELEDGSLDVESFGHAVDLTILAQEILVDNSGYPTEKIATNSYRYRPLGLGYANLGAFIMAQGLPYDSGEGRAWAAAITAYMTGRAYRMSALIAKKIGAFEGFEKNRVPFINVIGKHRHAVDKISRGISERHDFLVNSACAMWDDALGYGRLYGYRNAQATVLAPTGTISFMMDVDTTGIEPDTALVKYKNLVGGGMLKIVNQSVGDALDRLRYSEEARDKILRYIDINDTIEGCPQILDKDLPVFDCALSMGGKAKRTIHWDGHIRMMGACQPFLSGAISKTVNMPKDCTVDDIKSAYMMAWKLGLKAIAVYRDGCKRSQPLNTTAGGRKSLAFTHDDLVKACANFGVDLTCGACSEIFYTGVTLASHTCKASHTAQGPVIKYEAQRERLPDERRSITHKFSVGGHEGYIHLGFYDDGRPGEVFVKMSKEGSTISGFIDALCTAVSIGIQYGVPAEIFIRKHINTKFDPSGWTNHANIRHASSVIDYIFRWVALKIGVQLDQPDPLKVPNPVTMEDVHGTVYSNDAPSCHECGNIMVRSGSCYRCVNCGATSGCS